ncbi:NTP transferase domain-containing protein [Sodalis sp. dw_96]|uniref:nucleotidyltransferase family protein n=1 Tax=Sodalis sp. dw_96 TaxID=2719794 RepID=UPI001BD459AC|nr:NTP transferase domain-containing protein [Sodalis sp. dw_96]
MTPGILITAAGLGSRYQAAGGRGFKLDQQVADGRSVFQLTLKHACDSGLPVHVVTRSSYLSIQAHCRAMGVPYTCRDTRGLGETIAEGVRYSAGWDGWLIQLADMPFVPVDVYRLVTHALARHVSARPFYHRLPGHPVGFSRPAKEALLQLQDAEGAAAVLRRYPPFKIQVRDEGVVRDMDLPLQPIRMKG